MEDRCLSIASFERNWFGKSVTLATRTMEVFYDAGIDLLRKLTKSKIGTKTSEYAVIDGRYYGNQE